MTRERVAMNQSVSRGATFDLTQTHQVPSFEIAVTVLEFPKSGIRCSSVKDVAHCKISNQSYCVWRGRVYRSPVTYLYETRTYSTGAQRMIYWYA